jgi:proline iminopeptidase
VFPPIEPFASGLLSVSHGNELYWEVSGNPVGKPALHLHGGPGSGAMAGYRRRFDPEKFLIVGFDQRGCGRSRPLVTQPTADLSSQTMRAQIDDIEALREHLGVERWLITGASWGTTLALAYAQAHPDPVSELVLFAITTTSAAEVEWITETVGRIFPREWARFEAASGRASGERVVDAYYRRLTDGSPQVRAEAALAWCEWEDVHVSLDPRAQPDPRYRDAAFRELFATLVTHYWSHAAFAEGKGLIEGASALAAIPGILVHGRLDVSSPLDTAWRLNQAWPGSQLVVIDDEGHGGDRMIDKVVAAIARFAL